MFSLLLQSLMLIATAPAKAAPESRDPSAQSWVVEIRPHAGIGWASATNDSRSGLALHAGGRVLFPAPLSPKVGARFGLEATYLELDITTADGLPESYVAVGIVLEMTLFRSFMLGVGTLGYVGVGDAERNPFGLVTNLGWEPMWRARAVPFVTLRTEWVFDEAVYNILSLSAGVTFGI